MSGVIDPGSLKSRVDLLEQQMVADGLGGYEPQWNVVAQFHARIEPVAAFSQVLARTLETGVTHKVTLRHRVGIEPSMRLGLGTRRLEIVTMRDPDETSRYLELACRETKQA
ncbi:MAG: phage head closure protein [Nitratireductor sp.]